MRTIAFLISLSLFGATASAFIGIPGELTPVAADIHCEEPGGGIAVALPKAGQQARVWQTDPGSDMGLELEVVKFNLARCAGCFSFQAKLIGMPVFGEANRFRLKYWAIDEDGRPQTLLETMCRPSARREAIRRY